MKDSAFLGGGGKGEPTIVTPKQCERPPRVSVSSGANLADKTRFRTAMEKSYFPSVPDRWSKLGAEEVPIEEEGTS